MPAAEVEQNHFLPPPIQLNGIEVEQRCSPPDAHRMSNEDCSVHSALSSAGHSPGYHGSSFVINSILKHNLSGTGPNVVAIDNKIEQAMDLVKTHLMYAVREEVEILRAKITELEKKVVRLEKENAILRDHAPPEVIAQLVPSPSQLGNVPPGNPAVGGRSPGDPTTVPPTSQQQ